MSWVVARERVKGPLVVVDEGGGGPAMMRMVSGWPTFLPGDVVAVTAVSVFRVPVPSSLYGFAEVIDAVEEEFKETGEEADQE